MNIISASARLLMCASIASLAACAGAPKPADSTVAAAPCQRGETGTGSNIIHHDCTPSVAMTEEQKIELQNQLTNRIPPKVR
jgi:hypothetical protein